MKSLHGLGHQIWNYRCGTDASGNESCVLVVELSSVCSVSRKKRKKEKETPCNFVSLDNVSKQIECWWNELNRIGVSSCFLSLQTFAGDTLPLKFWNDSGFTSLVGFGSMPHVLFFFLIHFHAIVTPLNSSLRPRNRQLGSEVQATTNNNDHVDQRAS